MAVDTFDAFGSAEPSDERDPGEVHPLDRSDRIGRYRLCYELGAGGMATIYLARAEGPGGFAKPVAIKRIHPHLARRRDLVEMFLDEARIASLVNHPHVCSTFDFGEVGGSYYLAMEYLVGEPLNVLLRRAAQSTRLATTAWQRSYAKIIADCAEGLHAAHELVDERGAPVGVVHRDVSPQNLFVTYDGVAKVMDFGVAFAADRITQTVTGGIKGKIGYLAPEQILRRPFDRRVDVWALGIVLWEGLTGHRLFMSRSEVDTLIAIEKKVIPPPSRLVPSVPPELDRITLGALQRDPALRFPTARAMARELVGYLKSTGGLVDDVEVGELVQALCADRRHARTEVVASVMEGRVPTMTADPAPPLAVHEAETVVRGPRLAQRSMEPAAPSSPDLHGNVARLSLVVMAFVGLAAVALLAWNNGPTDLPSGARGATRGGAPSSGPGAPDAGARPDGAAPIGSPMGDTPTDLADEPAATTPRR